MLTGMWGEKKKQLDACPNLLVFILEPGSDIRAGKSINTSSTLLADFKNCRHAAVSKLPGRDVLKCQNETPASLDLLSLSSFQGKESGKCSLRPAFFIFYFLSLPLTNQFIIKQLQPGNCNSSWMS